MNYLMIENPGVAPVESFTLLGASSSRSNSKLIGQFGSGSKHGINLCLREKNPPVIFAGQDVIRFFTKPLEFNGEKMNQVYVSINDKTEKLSFCTEFGELDWKHIGMALREFISNAIDNSTSGISDISIKLVDGNPTAKKGHTRVFLKATDDVIQYYADINRHFLHFTGRENVSVIDKKDESTARFYRMGVFVRSCSERSNNSLFDYNFDDKIKIDECRNMDTYTTICEASKLLSKSNLLYKVFEKLISHETCWEISAASEFYLSYGEDSNWQEQWEKVAGDTLIASKEQSLFIQQVEAKGFKVQIIDSTTWFQAMKTKGIPTIIDRMNAIETKGQELISHDVDAESTFNQVWEWIKLAKMTQNHRQPKLQVFQKIMNCETMLNGYFDPKHPENIYLNKDSVNNKQVILEECAHYITGATDNSRDFQDYAFRLAVELAELI